MDLFRRTRPTVFDRAAHVVQGQPFDRVLAGRIVDVHDAVTLETQGPFHLFHRGVGMRQTVQQNHAVRRAGAQRYGDNGCPQQRTQKASVMHLAFTQPPSGRKQGPWAQPPARKIRDQPMATQLNAPSG